MNILLAGLVVVAFAVLLERTHVEALARKAADQAASTVRLMRDRALTDDQKERGLRQNSTQLFGLSSRLVSLTLFAMLLPLGCVWALDQAGLASMAGVLGVLQRLDFLLVATVVGIGAYYLSRIVAGR